MKNVFFYLILGCIIISCNNSSKQMDNNVENTSAEITEQNTKMPEMHNRYEANKSKPQFHSNCIPLIIFNAFIGFSYNNRYFT